ncbi:MFS transporter [Novosphingobium sp.]|uniref:spinster family MFS transporter n=1 Tax=Novosphingobium sp. TaxID=1874826 RepID=UPI0025D4BCC8|nr:MFS transporter [Novosphingobium sp.]
MPDTAPTGAERSDAYAWYVVGVLMLAYTLSYVDRTILSLMVAPIRASLHISDVQLSLLHGLAFALFYTFLGIPIGRLVDRRRRTSIVAVGVATWSVMTALCGAAQSFGQMFAARVGVGVGEAALSPAAFSMLGDWFTGKRLTRALSLYSAAIYLGGGIATMAGGALIDAVGHVETRYTGVIEPWRMVFMLVGLPGLFVGLLVATLREPERRGAVTQEVPSFPEVIAYLRARARAYGLLIGGLALASTMWNGVSAWIPAHFARNYGWTSGAIGLRYGAAVFVFSSAGILFGGWLAGRMRDRGRGDSNIRVGVISSLAALPFGVVATLMPTGWSCLGVLGFYLFAGAMPYGAAAAAFQEITPNRMRGQVSAIYLFALNLAGIGLGPTIVALLTQHVFGGDASVRYAIATVVAVAAPLSAIMLAAACKPYAAELASQRAASATA